MKTVVWTLLIFLHLVLYAFAQDNFRPFFGLLHSHTGFSDGSGTPAEAYQSAKDAGLHFFAITEHNHAEAAGEDGVFLTPSLYTTLKQAAADATIDGTFIALFGQEWSSISTGNHVNIFNAESIVTVPNGHFNALYETWLPSHPEVPLIQFNHPDFRDDINPTTPANKRNNDYGIDDYQQNFGRLVEASKKHVALIEIIVGPAFSVSQAKDHHDGRHGDDYLFYLNKGFKLGPSVGQDNHNKTWGTATHARLGLWASALTKDAIYQALAARRTYASEDENIQVTFTAGNAWMGSEVAVETGRPLDIHVSIVDPDEAMATYTVQLFYDDAPDGETATIIQGINITGDQQLTFTHTPEPGGYYLVKISQKSEAEDHFDDIWTSPIWVVAVPGETEPGEEHRDRMEIDWQEAADFIGRERIVTGKIVSTFNAGRALFLNFDRNFAETLTLVVLQEHFDDVGGAAALEQRVAGKTIKVRGTISTFRGRAQILLENDQQILEVRD